MAAQAELQLNGVADFIELRRSFYLAGLYVERTAEDGQVLVDSDQRKRMVLKVTAERWSPRSFSSHWTRSLLINNPADALNAFGDAVIEFNNLLQDDLVQGDILEIERGSDGATQVRLNGAPLLDLARPGFTEMLLRTWIGTRPPSTEFKQQILGLDANSERIARFNELAPNEQRVLLASSWAGGEAEPDAASDTPALQQDTDSDTDGYTVALRRPPSRDTVVRASMSAASTTAADTEVPAAAVAVSAPAAEPRQEAPAVLERPAVAVEEQTVAVLQPLADAVEAEARSAAPTVQPAAEAEAALSAEEEKALIELYQNMVVRKILSGVQYPDYALRRGLEGVVQLRVQVNRSGEILDIEEVVRTRYAVLNDAGRRAVEQVGEFPRVPAALPGDIILVDVPIRFQLR